jgi:tetratricopeptide (TPR) repeat protein
LASLIWVPFFYVLRPVLGAGPDWDLFALPALVYTPWLLLRLRDRISSQPQARYLVWAILVVSFFHTIPWIAVNARTGAAVARYQNLVIDLEGKNPWAAGYGWLKLGKYWQRLGRMDQALSAYDHSLAANPEYSVLYREVGEKMIEIGRLDLAVKRFEGFLQHNPTNPGAKPTLARARTLYAQSLEWQNRLPEAAAQYQAILALYPDHAEAQEALARLREKMAAGTGR